MDLIRQARADIYIQPNESEHKIYLFPRAQDMGLPGQNALLKVLEEPPAYGVFLLLTTNADALLPTVRSRCTELRMEPLPQSLLREELAKGYGKVSTEAISAAAERSGGFLARQSASRRRTARSGRKPPPWWRPCAGRAAWASVQLLVAPRKEQAGCAGRAFAGLRQGARPAARRQPRKTAPAVRRHPKAREQTPEHHPPPRLRLFEWGAKNSPGSRWFRRSRDQRGA